MIAQVAGHAKLSRAKISKENVRNNCRHKKLRKTQTFIEIGKAKKKREKETWRLFEHKVHSITDILMIYHVVLSFIGLKNTVTYWLVRFFVSPRRQLC